jgi:hypothetical protein
VIAGAGSEKGDVGARGAGRKGRTMVRFMAAVSVAVSCGQMWPGRSAERERRDEMFVVSWPKDALLL